jgi:hypothetical protein
MSVANRLRIGRAVRMLTPWFPNAEIGWVPQATSRVLDLIEENGYDAIYSTSTPISSHLIGLWAKRRTGIPWVADYRDEWSLREIMRWPTDLHRRAAVRIDRAITGAADHLVTSSPAHSESYGRVFLPDEPEKITTITNGYEPADLEVDSISRSLRASAGAERFLLAHVGTLPRWRSAEALLAVVRQLADSGLEDRIRLVLVGTIVPVGNEDLVERGILQVTGYVDHATAVAWMKAADALVLVNTETTNILGKTFEYLAVRKPILPLLKPGPTADLVALHGAGRPMDPDDRAEIRSELDRLVGLWQASRLEEAAHTGDLHRYERRHLAGRLARVLDSIIPEQTLPHPSEENANE